MEAVTAILFQNVTAIITILNVLLAVTVIFLERRNVGETWAWLMVLFFLPLLGFILYVVFGQNLSRRKLYRLKAGEKTILHTVLEEQREQLERFRFPFREPLAAHYRDLIMMNLISSYSAYSQDNLVDIYTEGNEKFEALLRDIEGARDHVHLLYFIVHDSGIARRLRDALTRKAREGVEVRFLYDDIGSYRLPGKFFEPLLKAGGYAEAFFPTRFPYLNIRVNYRNHRKLVIIDGRIGYIGGLNIGDEYLGLSPRFGYWRDTHLRVGGSSVLQMQALFLMDWNLASEKQVEPEPRYFPYEHLLGTEGVKGAGMQIVASGPDHPVEQIKNGYIRLIHKAQNSVWIQTPYFIPDESLLSAIKMAAMSGIDVRIMIPKVPDHKMVYWATTSYLGELLPLGVRCFMYGKGFLHAKTIVVDGVAASVGTANFDIRSFRLNFESNAFIFDPAICSRLYEIYLEDLKECTEWTLFDYSERPVLHKFRESVTRLLSPIL